MRKFSLAFVVFVICLFFSMVFAGDDVLLISSYGIAPAPQPFIDVDDEFWASKPIERWADEGVIKGYEDDTYRPSNAITRAEFVTMLDRIFVPYEKADLSNFKDVDTNAWYYDSLAKAVKMGILKGYSDTELGPNIPITRQEAMTIVARILNAGKKSSAGKLDFKDANEIASWAEDAIELMTSAGYVNGYEDGTVRPNNNITRAEVAKILDKTYALVIHDSGVYDMGKIEGNVVITADDVEFVNTEITGTIYTSPTVDEKTVVMTNSKAEGDIVSTNEIVEPTTEPEEEPVEEKKSSGGSQSSVRNITFKMTVSDDYYCFAKSGSAGALRLNDRLTVYVEDSLIIDNVIITSSNVKSEITKIIEAIDEDKILPTVARYKSDSTVQSLGFKVVIALGRPTEDYDDIVEGRSSTNAKDMMRKTLEILTPAELIDLANVVAK